jgi:hypothetical protein
LLEASAECRGFYFARDDGMAGSPAKNMQKTFEGKKSQ